MTNLRRSIYSHLVTLTLAAALFISFPLAQAPSLTQLESRVRALVDRDRFSGVVLLAQDSQVVFQAAYGRANETGEPVTLGTRFPLASLSKMFTAVAVARLAEDGKLSFDDPVSLYLPDYPSNLTEGVTLKQLLSHTSGLGNFDFADIQPMRSVDEMLGLSVARTAYAPGERFYYSNMGYVLLGGVIETVTGQSFDAFLQTVIFEPLSMDNTGAQNLSSETPGLASGFTNLIDWSFRQDPASRHGNAFFRVSRGGPAGDLVSTAGDLLAFMNALQLHTLIDAETTALITAPKVNAFRQVGLQADYAYGFEVIDWEGVRSIGHSGEAAGESTLLRMYPDSGYTLIVLSNYDGAAREVEAVIHEFLVHSAAIRLP